MTGRHRQLALSKQRNGTTLAVDRETGEIVGQVINGDPRGPQLIGATKPGEQVNKFPGTCKGCGEPVSIGGGSWSPLQGVRCNVCR